MCLALHIDWLSVCLALFFSSSTLHFLSPLFHTTASECFLDSRWLRQRPAHLLPAKTPYQELAAGKQDGRTVRSVPGILLCGTAPGLSKVVGGLAVHLQLWPLCVINARNFSSALSGCRGTAGSVCLFWSLGVSAQVTSQSNWSEKIYIVTRLSVCSAMLCLFSIMPDWCIYWNALRNNGTFWIISCWLILRQGFQTAFAKHLINL